MEVIVLTGAHLARALSMAMQATAHTRASNLTAVSSPMMIKKVLSKMIKLNLKLWKKKLPLPSIKVRPRPKAKTESRMPKTHRKKSIEAALASDDWRCSSTRWLRKPQLRQRTRLKQSKSMMTKKRLKVNQILKMTKSLRMRHLERQ